MYSSTTNNDLIIIAHEAARANPSLSPLLLELASRLRKLNTKLELNPPPTSLLTCPLCNETDFDLIGLKHHLSRYCSGLL